MKKNKGFTLIELLVVIALIGILASIVAASINSVREKKCNADGYNTTNFCIKYRENSILSEDDKNAQKDACLEKMTYRSISDLPAGCIQYIELPDGISFQDVYK